LAAYIGSLLLLYTIASGLSLKSTAVVDASATQQHGVVGTVGAALCIAGLVMLLRQRS